MSTAFARAIVDGMRRHGITVHELAGCWSRGNGQSWPVQPHLGGMRAPDGSLTHHTAGSFDGGMSLLRDGRSDLSGPLCNMAGHADGDLTLVAAFPANHAGAGAGRSMGPLPRTRAFNARVWGLEVMYPGTVPMTPAQMRTAQILAGVVCGTLRRPHPEWARFHADTSSTGKWDPGYAPGRTYDSPAFRRGIWAALHSAPGAPAPPPGAPPPPPPPPGRPVLREGATGAAVAELQRFLNRVFPSYSRIDLAPQRYGPQTIGVVREFQRRSGLVADGITGPATYAALSRHGF